MGDFIVGDVILTGQLHEAMNFKRRTSISNNKGQGQITESIKSIVPGGFISKSGWESDFDLKNWLLLSYSAVFAPLLRGSTCTAHPGDYYYRS